ncbi:receptor-type tyrosine-protein phosphatase mu-like isoform X2 [Mya arenaria]|uniref:receptor-type tyrosine-protein phosphatase mu-like isoform X2 n=1 Tax=Mya arenaria TaxID=6604 RepID=UPI0022E43967|nr:receptor-type tyrosine-protein phosphatase mu-like isoform X2 [Mya arenaria]
MIKMIPGKMVTFAVLFLLVRVVCTQECSTCQCCADGYHPKCSSRGYCNNGCIDGYYGEICNYKCTSQNCLSCDQHYGNNCLKCIPGYYLENHNCYDCGPQCQSCSSYGCNSCYDGYWGNTCGAKCTHNCVSCNKYYGNCLSCAFGYYVYNRKCAACGAHCAVCGSGGCISCHGGYWGRTCDKNCAQNCASCKKSGGCLSCVSGYYLYYRKCTTCGYHCAECGSSGCTSCHDGYWGSTCNENCAQNCASCSKSDGNCLSCSSGYWGNTCEKPCGHHCLACDKWNGRCLSCEHGYWGHPCTECKRDMCVNQFDCDLCSNISFYANSDVCCLCRVDNCVSCSKALDTVNCKVCKQGYYPQINGKCELCNAYCFNKECDSSSGVCLQGCINGYWNPTCDRKCDSECLSCSQADGLCTRCKNTLKFGPNCRSECSSTCKNSKCDNNGNCMNGCIQNAFGKQCENKCDGSCSPKDNGTICSEKTGMCLYGCQTGYKGRVCPQEAETQTSSIAVFVGGVGGGAAALAAILVVGLILLRRRKVNLRNKRQTPETEPENLSALYATVNKGRTSQADYTNEDTDNLHSVTIIENTNYQSSPPQSSVKENMPILTEDNLEIDNEDFCAREFTNMIEKDGGVNYNNAREISKFELTVADLPKYVQNKSVKDLEEEFQKVPHGLVKPYEVSQTKLNMNRNRYNGIYPYDDSRVIVRGGDTDYINASYIDGFRKRNAYIAALGPMAKQLGDFGQFWRMAWQQKVEKIVMVTHFVEGEKTKCEQYWPDHGQRKLYGDIEVVCKVERLYADFIWRQLTLSKGKHNFEERNLHHLQFTAWPDKDIPDDVTSIIEFRQKVNALPSTFNGPVIVHCSAGVGRTGTYIALDILTKEGETEGAIDIPGCVFNMRQNRPSMIQTLSQYKFLHEALVHSLSLDCSLIKREHFHEYMNMMSSKQEIQKQFEKMQLNQERKSEQELQAMERNRLLTKKNRKYADIPGDSNRPRLYLFLKPGESDYINAIYINSFKTKDRFLVAQTPLADTVFDFVALAVQENCSCIVSMEAQGIGLYAPGDNLSMKKGVISIRSARDQSSRHFVKRKLHFEPDEKAKPEIRIPHYEYLDWDRNDDTPKSAEHFVAFIKEVEDASKSSHLNGPILVHCMNGAGKSGLLCVVSTLLETLSEDKEVSVVNAVRKVRARRPLSIPNKEQFFFCYECVLQSLNTTDDAVYYNTSANIKRK